MDEVVVETSRVGTPPVGTPPVETPPVETPAAETPEARAVYQPMIQEMPLGERPRERLLYYGAGALSTAELLAILLRVGVRGTSAVNLAAGLLARYGGLAGLAQAGFDELVNTHGMGPAKVTQVKAALELGRRLLVESPQERPRIGSPADAANLVLAEMGLLEQEQLRLILLDTKNHVLEMPTVYVGNLNTSLIRVGELFRYALRKNNCAGMIVIHNHPSGDPTPSPEDIRVTERIVEAGDLMDVEIMDHLIIGRRRWVSLKERRLGFR
jgi:DNA repair protein RadC